MDRKTKYLTVYTFGTTRQVFWVEDKRGVAIFWRRLRYTSCNFAIFTLVDLYGLISQTVRRFLIARAVF